MAGSTHFIKTIFIPLFLAALLYILLAFLILPFIRRHRSRYSQYLPLPAGSLPLPSASSWRTTLSDALYNLFVPSTWGRNRRGVVDGSSAHDDELFDDEEGEGMVGFEPFDERGREALERRRSGVGEERRVGRELEVVFKDDSDEEDGDEEARRRSLGAAR